MVYILQSRDITTLPVLRKEIKKGEINAKSFTLKGVAASPGKTEGIVQFVLDDQPPKEAEKLFKKGNILVTYVLHPEYYAVFTKAKGIITKVDTILAHPAIFARELGIPFVVGVDIEYIKDGDRICVDGYTGEVVIHSPRNVLKLFPLTESKIEVKSKEAKKIREEYIIALENIDTEKIKQTIKYSFKRIKELYLGGEKNKSFEIYYLINSLMEKTTPNILSRKFKGLSNIVQKADRKEKPQNETEKKIFEIYNLIKKYLNYQTKDSKDIPKLLFGI